ncbi:MAG: membrane protein insertase YidC [Treponema sp.]|nr:membrane protein insertase YidC [Treponema sp.]
MFLTFLSNIIIAPLKTILELFFNFFTKISNQGLAVIGLSFVVTLCCLPLYIVAEQWQEQERKIQLKLKPGVDRIKKAFKKDEQYMILTTFYRQNHYHPMMALRSSFSLLIQIPFFIAAYSFLSHVDALKGYSFLFIKDMGSPDAFFKIGNFSINILPIAMTLINCISGTIYSKGHALKEKLQIYITAAVFLVLLYNSPSGLVLYWTMNNVLSLVKNVFYKFKNPLKVLYILFCIFFIVASGWSFTTRNKLYITAFLSVTIFVIFIPFIIKAINWFISKCLFKLDENKKLRLVLFVISSVILAVTAGLTIPATIIDSSSSDYFYIDSYTTPLPFLFNAFTQALGLFIFWPCCLYALFPNKIKDILCFLGLFFAFTGILNCFAFSGNYGLMNIDFSLMDEAQSFMLSTPKMILIILLTISIIILLIILIRKKTIIPLYISSILLLGLTVTAVINIIHINKNFKETTPPEQITKLEPQFHLSKTEKNVIVFMEDRSVSGIFPYIFSEIPELKETYEGFTYYPNTVSMSYYTTLGAPGLFGGYDYTPWEANKRTDFTIREKHNQSLLVMPTLFTQAGFDVTITNMPYENYNMQPVEQIYSNLPELKRVKTQGAYSNFWYNEHGIKPKAQTSFLIKRNMLFFSLFKLVNPAFRVIVYGCGYRLLGNPFKDEAYLIDTYAPLDYLPELTDFDAENNTFLIFDNELTHSPGVLQAPDFVPVENVTNSGWGKFENNSTYHINTAMLLRIGEFIEYLKQNDCYDNTRIIIVSDHGNPTDSGLFENNQGFSKMKEELQAVLLVKDFNSKDDFKIDNTFMTNADTPSLALKDIVQNPLNPFTKNPINITNKDDYIKISTAPMQSLRTRDDRQYTVRDDEWLTVHDDIFNNENWSVFIPEKNK